MNLNKEKNYSHEWIQKLESELHWQLYWKQLDLIFNKIDLPRDKTICEIGVGSGLTSSYLKRKGYDISTIDIDPNKKPDIVGDITKIELPFADLYLAFEVFEHIPFKNACNVWEKLAQNGVSYLAFSLPYAARTYFWLRMWSPYFGWKNIHIGRKRNRINTQHHFWELNYKNSSVALVKDRLIEYGYELKHTKRFRNHHFFIAKLMKGEK